MRDGRVINQSPHQLEWNRMPKRPWAMWRPCSFRIRDPSQHAMQKFRLPTSIHRPRTPWISSPAQPSQGGQISRSPPLLSGRRHGSGIGEFCPVPFLRTPPPPSTTTTPTPETCRPTPHANKSPRNQLWATPGFL
jgi:hypothetical protein